MLFFYREVDVLNKLISKGYHDETIRALDHMLFRGDPRDHLHSLLPYFWVEGLLNAGYLSYYFFLPVGGIPLALKSRWKELEEFSFLNFLTYSICNICFILYPVVGPLFDLHPVGSFVFSLVDIGSSFAEYIGRVRFGAHLMVACSIFWK